MFQINNKAYKIGVYVFVLTLLLIELFLKINFATRLNPSTIVIIAETNGRETAEFFQTYLATKGAYITFAAIIIIGLILYIAEQFKYKTISALHKICFLKQPIRLLILFCLVCSIWQSRCLLHLYGINVPANKQIDDCFASNVVVADVTTNLLFTYHSYLQAKEQVSMFAAQTEKALRLQKAKLINSNDSTDVIFIIGESYIKHHASLYGYVHQTTPVMDNEQKLGNLFPFSDVITYIGSTSDVMKNMFSTNNEQKGENWWEHPAFPAIFKQTGYYVTLWDNQNNFSKNTAIDFAMTSVIVDSKMTKLSYNHINNKNFQYDGEIISELFKFLSNNKNSHRLIILHLLGQHVAFSSKYPHDKFTYFTTDSIHRNEPWLTTEKKQVIADYDNAVRYNDAQLGRIFEYFYNRNAVVVYLSDHGEEAYDYRDSQGRVAPSAGLEKKHMHCIHDIPFIIWASPKFQNNHPEIIIRIKEAKDKPFTADNISNILFYLGAVKSSYYHANENPLDTHFKTKHRKITGDKDYDALK